MKITVVVPNYNGLEGLKVLLPELTRRGFSSIYVVDDGSTDESIDYAKTFPGIRIIAGKRNLGPAGNRNRILGEKHLGDLIWFVDADMELVSDDVGRIAKKLFGDPGIALVGGMILTMRGTSYYWNYGYEMHPLRDRLAQFYGNLARIWKENPKIFNILRRYAIRYFYGLEIDAGNHVERQVEWVAEGNFLVRTDVFKTVGGFDSNMRYHEGHDIGKRIRQLGFRIMFSPEIVTRHLEIECRDGKKPREWYDGRKYFFRKHWGNPRKAFRNFFRLED